MALIKAINTPGGAAVGFHQIARLEGAIDSTHLMALVQSWPTREDYINLAGKSATYLWPVPVPVGAVLDGTGDLVARCEAALTTYPDAVNPFVGASTAPNVTDLETAKALRWANIKQTREALDIAPIPLEDFAIDADASSRNDIMGAVMAMQLTGETSRMWRCADNVMRQLTFAQIVAAGTAIAARRQGLIETSDTLYQAIQAATTLQQVNDVKWPVLTGGD